MAGYDRKIDPVTGDYVDEEGGEYAETLTIATALYHQVRGERNRWWGDPQAGSDLHLVRHQGAGVAGKVFAENAIRTAAQPFIDSGEAADLEVAVDATANGRVVLEASITDVQFGRVELDVPLGEV